MEQLRDSFDQYCGRIHQNNNMNLVRILRTLSPIKVFKPCLVHLNDLDVTLKFDYVIKSLEKTHDEAQVSMRSESLNFIFKNSFGFDTLTVNGCFEEASDSGFSRATRTLAIENLNNMGIEFRPSIILNYQIIIMFIE